MERLSGRVAVVTGATSGIGEAIAERLAAEGAQVLVSGRHVERGEQVAQRIGGLFARCDVTREPDVAALVQTAMDRFGRLDCYVSNAGDAGTHGSIVDIDEEGFDHTVTLLLRGAALGMKYACQAMRAHEGGSFISTGSGAAVLAGLAPHIYSACKAALVGLTRSVAFEEGRYGIRVNCVCPGGVETPIFARTTGVYGDEELTLRLNAAVAATVSAATALHRIGMPAEIAGAVAWLASDDSSYVTGQAIVVDGGQTIGKALGQLPDGLVPTASGRQS